MISRIGTLLGEFIFPDDDPGRTGDVNSSTLAHNCASYPVLVWCIPGELHAICEHFRRNQLRIHEQPQLTSCEVASCILLCTNRVSGLLSAVHAFRAP